MSSCWSSDISAKMNSLRGSLHASLVNTAERHGGQREALRDSVRSHSLEDLISQSQRLAGAFVEHGVSLGDRVVICASNRTEFVVAHFAVLFAGGISVPVDQSSAASGIELILKATLPKVFVTTYAPLRNLRQRGIKLPAVVILIADGEGDGDAETEKVESFSDLVENGRAFFSSRNVEHSTILYTTGSSGRPKGVLLSHAATLHTTSNVMEFVGYSPNDREVVSIPVTHSFGLGHIYCNLFSGGAVYLENGLLNVKRVLTTIQNWGATGFPGTPLGFGLLLDTYGSAFEKYAHGLRFIVVNSAPLSPERAAQLHSALPGTEFFVYYGLTEASRSTFISLTRSGPSKYASVGKPMCGVNISLSSNEGEILIHGPHLAHEYWMDEDLSSRVFSLEGLRSGDLGKFDGDGFLYVTGRLSDLINFGGYKIDPIEVEQWLCTFPEIADAGVTAVESTITAEDVEVVAMIVVKNGFTLDDVSLFQRTRAGLDLFKVPRRWIKVGAIPRSATGKILRAELRQVAISNMRNDL